MSEQPYIVSPDDKRLLRAMRITPDDDVDALLVLPEPVTIRKSDAAPQSS